MKYIFRVVLFVFAFMMAAESAFAQRKITYLSTDKLVITADLYMFDAGAPFMILLHKENSSREEYAELAPKFNKLGFNCLVPDLRSGKDFDGIKNETAALAHREGIACSQEESLKDINASINYIQTISQHKFFLAMGSYYTASALLKMANSKKRMVGLIVSAPSEREMAKKEEIAEVNIPVFALAQGSECQFMKDYVGSLPNATLFEAAPSTAPSALHSKSKDATTCWMSLMFFLKPLQSKYFLKK